VAGGHHENSLGGTAARSDNERLLPPRTWAQKTESKWLDQNTAKMKEDSADEIQPLNPHMCVI